MPTSMFRRIALATALFAFGCTPALAQNTIHVPADQPTIQAGINAANNGDTVLVAPNTYYENIDFKGKAITVTSSDGAAKTIIDGGAAGPTVAMISGETRSSVLSNLTITHGGPASSNFGFGGVGGVEIANSMPTILNNIITQNYCQGISVNSAAPLIQGNVVSSSLTPEKCSVSESGGILIGNPYPSATYPYVAMSSSIIGNTIENNTTGQQGDGGGDGGAGIEVWGSAPLIEDNIIRNNTTVTGSGGGINIVFGNDLSIVQNLIYGNSAGCGGGAIGFGTSGGVGAPVFIIANNTIVDNIGGINPEYTDCAQSSELWSSFDESGPTTLFVNNIISGTGSFPAFVCGLSYYASSQQPSEGYQALFDHNLLYDGSTPFFGNYCVDTSNLHGNISADPQFADPANGDYHLKPTSPAIDAGNNSALQELLILKSVSLTQDFDGQPREQDATGKGSPIIDMGAYEFGGTVDASPTSIVLSPSAYTGSAGSNYTLTATLSSAAGVPTGPVTFFLDGQQIGVAAANGGVAILNNVAFKPGVHVAYATYPGQGSFPPAISVVVIIQIDRYSSSLTITSSPNPSFVGQPVTFTVKATSSDPTYVPTPVTLTDYLTNTPIATLTPDSSGTATYTTSSLSVGFHDIYANYAGDSAHIGASADVGQTVLDPNSTTINASSSLNPSILGQNVTFTATVTSAGGSVPTGSITFTDGSSPLGSVALDPSGKATFTTSALTVGTQIITLTYVPIGTFETSSAVLYQQVISGYSVSASLTSSLNPSITGQNVTFTATITSTNGTPTGTIQFTDNGNTLGTQPLNASGAATFSTSTLTVGSHNITATYIPTGSFAGTSVNITQIVNAVTNTVNVTSSLNPSTFGQAVTFTAHINSNAGTVSGTVAFYDIGNYLGQQIVDPSGNAAIISSTLTVGAHTITATFTPAGSATPSSGALTQQVNGLATSTLLTATPLTGVAHITTITLTATVSPAVPAAGVTLTGQVLFYVNGAQFALVTMVNGVATYTGTLPAGADQIYALYVGDPNRVYDSSNSNTVTVTITAAPSTLSLSSSTNPAFALRPFSISAQLGVSGGTQPGAGYPITITLTPATPGASPTTSGTASTNASGIATFAVPGLLPGQYVVTATFAGTTDLQPSTATSFIETVVTNPTTTSLTASPNPGFQNNAITFTSTVAAVDIVETPSGTVTIYDSLSPNPAFSPIATLTLPSATFTTSALAPGTHILYAAYTPTAAFTPSQSSQLTLVIEPQSFTLTLSNPTLTIQTGHHSTETVSLTSIGGLTGSFTLGCGTLPVYATCTWGQTSVTLPANGTVSTGLTLDTDQLIGFLASANPKARPTQNVGAPFITRTLRDEWGGTMLATLLPLTLLGFKRRRNLRTLLSLLILAAVATTLTACGANQYPYSTAPGTYIIPITATGTATPNGVTPTQTANLTLVVTQ
jgi:hypothetical protein